MNITAELSLYPLQVNYDEEILGFLEKIQAIEGIAVEINAMSTLITGNYDAIMSLLTTEMNLFLKDHKAVFILKVSNGCLVDNE